MCYVITAMHRFITISSISFGYIYYYAECILPIWTVVSYPTRSIPTFWISYSIETFLISSSCLHWILALYHSLWMVERALLFDCVTVKTITLGQAKHPQMLRTWLAFFYWYDGPIKWPESMTSWTTTYWLYSSDMVFDCTVTKAL